MVYVNLYNGLYLLLLLQQADLLISDFPGSWIKLNETEEIAQANQRM